MGRLIIPKTRDYLYIASGTGLSPNINSLKFYDSGLIYNGKKSFYSEDGQYAIWYVTSPVGIWLIGSIANIGTFTTNAWGKVGATDTVAGSYTAAGDKVGTVTISEYKNKISIKKQNLGGGKINLRPRVYAYKATGTGLSPNINNLRFYDTGLIRDGQPIYYDETKVYWLAYVSNAWIIALIGTLGGSGLFVKFGGTPVGSYSGTTGYSGTVTISAI
jgi:hypothetical protein